MRTLKALQNEKSFSTNFAPSALDRGALRTSSFFAQVKLIGTLRFDLNIDRDRLADARDRFGCGSKHQIKVTPRDRIGRDRPARPPSFIRCRQ